MAIHEISVRVSGRLRNAVTPRKAEANHEVTPCSGIFRMSLKMVNMPMFRKIAKPFFPSRSNTILGLFDPEVEGTTSLKAEEMFA